MSDVNRDGSLGGEMSDVSRRGEHTRTPNSRLLTPVLSIVGRKNSGKTTFLAVLIPELKRRGYRVGALKHDVHGFEVDIPGKDTYRMREAGADVVAIASPERFVVQERLPAPPELDDLVARLVPLVDILFTEGYRSSPLPKIEISRTERSTELICRTEELFAVVTDHENVPPGIPRFPLGDAAGVAALIENRFDLNRARQQ